MSKIIKLRDANIQNQMPGDVILTRGEGLTSELIIKGQNVINAGDSTYSHVLICVLPGLFAEATGKEVINYFLITDEKRSSLDSKNWQVLRNEFVKNNTKLQSKIQSSIQYHIGKSYSIFEMGKRIINEKDEIDNPTSFCSQFVCNVYKSINDEILSELFKSDSFSVYPVSFEGLINQKSKWYDNNWTDVKDKYLENNSSDIWAQRHLLNNAKNYIIEQNVNLGINKIHDFNIFNLELLQLIGTNNEKYLDLLDCIIDTNMNMLNKSQAIIGNEEGFEIEKEVFANFQIIFNYIVTGNLVPYIKGNKENWSSKDPSHSTEVIKESYKNSILLSLNFFKSINDMIDNYNDDLDLVTVSKFIFEFDVKFKNIRELYTEECLEYLTLCEKFDVYESKIVHKELFNMYIKLCKEVIKYRELQPRFLEIMKSFESIIASSKNL